MKNLSSESKLVALRSRRWRLKLGLAAALATMVLVAPTALARPAGAGAGAGLDQLSHEPSGVSTGLANPPATGGVVLHRDGSKAVPFVADLAPTGTQAADGFDWGDAAVGLGAGLIVAVLGLGAIGAYGGRRTQTA
jgi:hypothetical protein